MATIRENIIGYMDSKGWVNKATICDDIRELRSEGYVYIETIGRELRRMKKDGLLASKRQGRGTLYLLIARNAVEALETLHSKPLHEIQVSSSDSLIDIARKLRAEREGSEEKNLTIF